MPRRREEKKTYLDFVLKPYGFETDFDDTELPDDVARVKESFLSDPVRALYDIGFKGAEPWYSASLSFLHKISSAFADSLTRIPDIETLRERSSLDYAADLDPLAKSVPFIPGSENVSPQWILMIWERLMGQFRMDIMGFDGSVELYLASRSNDLHAPGRIFFHLVENKDPLIVHPFLFMATYSPEPEGDEVKAHVPLKYALEEYRDDNRKMLSLMSNLYEASNKSAFISSLIDSGEIFHPLGFSTDEAYQFLTEVPVYESCGVLCRIPNWWKHRQGASLNIEINSDGSFMGAGSLLSLCPSLEVDGVPITEDEIERLLNSSEGLARLKGKWVEVNHSRLSGLLERMKRIREEYGDGISFSEAFKLSSGMADAGTDEGVRMTNSSWMSEVFAKSRERSCEDLEISDSFKETLRPYQEVGVRWLSQLSDLSFGACLADDMGLGKSAQLLAFIESTKKEGDRDLLVVPASLIGNWRREISKFTPDLEYSVYSGKDDPIGAAPLTITTYGQVSRHPEFGKIEWSTIAIDEAQAIKNPSTKQSKAIRALKGRFKIAMTGTPVENRLQDLWSLFDYSNPGLLGSADEFERFVDKMDERRGYQRLRSATAPFILRRLKTDKSIISDLPEKFETNEMIALSKKQRVLYNKVLSDFAEAIENPGPQSRLGLVLSTITKFKQICNHPDQYLGQKEFAEADSGKFAMLRELCETISERKERVLVFTQYKEMTGPISEFLSKVFGKKGLVFHGSMTKKARDAAVSRFCSENEYVPFMVISLKAGGTGLNLTAANHVIHFDRWWNPAVENQATDRAFRIGQTKDVLVHKFVCSGTMEERIDEMIRSKSQLAEDVVGEGESWISRMDDEELLDLFRLG